MLFVRTDHLSLVTAINKGHGEHSPIEQRLIAECKEYNPIMVHIPGIENCWAGLLSRPNDIPPRKQTEGSKLHAGIVYLSYLIILLIFLSLFFLP